jgi:hypothetical protein
LKGWKKSLSRTFSPLAFHMSISIQPFATGFQKDELLNAITFSTPVLLITKLMKMDCPQWSISNTNSGHSPAALDGTAELTFFQTPTHQQAAIIVCYANTDKVRLQNQRRLYCH